MMSLYLLYFNQRTLSGGKTKFRGTSRRPVAFCRFTGRRACDGMTVRKVASESFRRGRGAIWNGNRAVGAFAGPLSAGADVTSGGSISVKRNLNAGDGITANNDIRSNKRMDHHPGWLNETHGGDFYMSRSSPTLL
ncbi:shufflon system plasmid conjugative transfer pilus tip adhesin PilV [Erwinia tasmaniensis]